MAITLNSVLSKSVVGNKREVVLDVTISGANTGTIRSGLQRVEHASYTPAKGGDDQVVSVSINSATASATQDDAGQVHMASVSDPTRFYLRCRGV